MFTYQKETNTFLCPFQKSLKFTHLNWNRKDQQYYQVYAAKTVDCRACPFSRNCLSPTAQFKTITKPIFHEYGMENYIRSQTEEYKRVRPLRNTWSEGTFGVLKQCHGFAKTYLRGIGFKSQADG